MGETTVLAEMKTNAHIGNGAMLQTCVGFFFAFRTCITYIGFQSDARLGTAVTLAISGCFLLSAVIYTMGDDVRSLRALLRSTTMRWLLAYLAVAGVSLLWTQAESPGVAAGYWMGMVTDVATTVLLLGGASMRSQLDAMMRGFAAGMLVVAVIAWVSPRTADMRMGNDDFMHPNFLGLELALAFFMAQHLAVDSRHWRWVAVALGISLLRTISKTSIIACMIAECFYLLRETRISRRAKMQIATITIVAIVAFWGVLETYFTTYATEGNQAETLTGRTDIWLVALGMAIQQPWFGSGIYSFHSLIPSFGAFEPRHAHNEFIEQFFELGAAGVLTMAGLYLSLFREGLRSARCIADWPYGKLATVLVVFAIVHGLTDTVNFDLSLPLWLFTGLAIAIYRRREEAGAA